MDGWIVIPNWRRFQHYKNRNPKWIKVYTELMSDPAFLGLTFAQRGLLISLWLEYARSRHAIKMHTSTIARQLGERVFTAQLEALNDAGFIEVSASKPLAKVEHSASPELLRNSNSEDAHASAVGNFASTEKKGSPREQLLAAAHRYAAGWNGSSSDAFEEGLDELEHLTGAKLGAGDRYELWDQALSEDQLH